MRMSDLFGRTLRKVPGTSAAPGHEYLLRAGYIRQNTGEGYTLLPLARRVQLRIEEIVREEFVFPLREFSDSSKDSGEARNSEEEDIRGRLSERRGMDSIPGGPEEDTVIETVKDQAISYRQLPVLLYGFQPAGVDNGSVKSGLCRVRRGKTAYGYSFDRDDDGLQSSYVNHSRAYGRILERCVLQRRRRLPRAGCPQDTALPSERGTRS
jgi:prolyl-tRNA synthetase